MSMTGKTLPFLFIHGAGGTKAKWREVQPLLNGDEAIVIDLPGHGDTPPPAYRSIERYAQQISELVQQDVIAVGHSMGGMIALELGVCLQQVKGVVMAMSHYELPVHPDVFASLKQGIFPPFLFRASYSSAAEPALLEEEERQLSWVPSEVTLADFTCCHMYHGADVVSRLGVPLFAVYGSDDKLLPPGARESLLALRPDTHIEVIEQAGHYAILEQPGQFVESLLRFRDQLLGE